MKPTRHPLALAAALSTLALACFAGAAAAQSFPTKPIRVVVPFPPGGVDVTLRLMQNTMAEDLGQPLVLENRAGANGYIGTEYVAHSPPDGYTILATSSSTLIAGPLVSTSVPFDTVKDFAPIVQIFSTVSVMLVKPSLQINTVQELIDFARRNPGKLSYASTGIGSAQHLDAETFKYAAGVDLVHIPYKGFGPVAQAVMGGEVDVSYVTVQTGKPLLAAGKAKLLATYNGPRPSFLPRVPDLAEAVPGFKAGAGFIGLLAPAATPSAVVRRLNAAAVKSLRVPDVVAKVEDGGSVVVANSPEEFAAEIKSSLEDTGKIVKALRTRGVKFE